LSSSDAISDQILTQEYWQISPVDSQLRTAIRAQIDQKTKPLGALGELETLAESLALIFASPSSSSEGQISQLQISPITPCVMVFAADHGIGQHPISIAPQAVTAEMVANFLRGGAAINCLCESMGADIHIVDAGVLTKTAAPRQNQTTSQLQFTEQRVDFGTQDLSAQAAMTRHQLKQALTLGEKIMEQKFNHGYTAIAFGEMGIGNTSSASAILAALLGLTASQTSGMGTGITDTQLALKIELIDKGLGRVQEQLPSPSPMDILQQLGGFEIAQLVGAMLACAAAKKLIIVDGFIVSVAALVAYSVVPATRDYMVFAHTSAEQGHSLALDAMQAKPLLNLGLRLGEGTGAALAIPLVKAAAAFFNDMATLDTVSVTID
jgi:nicotinate-nucleotide--dimethylbenzimidazole phosphoribosyltransferase